MLDVGFHGLPGTRAGCGVLGRPALRPVALLALGFVIACGERNGRTAEAHEAADAGDALFSLLVPAATGVRFVNELRETRDLNVFTYRNYYNGGGVAIGDLTGDSLPEIILTSNLEGARLFINEGAFRFRDETRAAGLSTPARSWTTGVTLADVNGDGRLDIYLSRAGSGTPAQRANELWLNEGVQDGVPRFREAAAQHGIADPGYTTHAAFLDYDRDGDLDLFIVNNSPRPVSSFGPRNTRAVRDPFGGHKLYRNDGARFTDVSARAGIHGSEIGFGLGVGVGDVNRDGWPDVWVANDFFERDYLFINRGDGTFDETLDSRSAQLTYFSMGMDIGDLDNDAWPDVYTTDMLPEDEYRLKTMASFESWDVYRAKVRDGYHHQFMRNMLQRNNGDGTFSDIGQMAGVAQTDWSWSALIADLDLDGLKDIFVTNGIAKDLTSQDYIAFLANEETMRGATDGGRSRVDFERLVKAMSETPLPNYAFRNRGEWRFENAAQAWGLATPSFSSGAAYGDLDGDGAPDLVVNNVNGEAFVYRNNARTRHPEHRFLRVRLEGEGGNRFAIGARVTLHADTLTLVQEQAPARGFQSSVDYVLTFGLGTHSVVDSLHVLWPDGRTSMQRNVQPNALLTLRQSDATQAAPLPPQPRSVLARAENVRLDYRHRENDFIDFDRERLIPRMLSTEGPALAVGDVNGDGLDDLYLGGAKEQAGRLMLQRPDGSFAASNAGLFESDAISEDVAAVFFDADGDRDLDLFVVSGGSEFSEGAPALQDRLYVNMGRGTFTRAVDRLPAEAVAGSRAAVGDFDRDGDLDLFVGGRVVPWRYGTDPVSTLLRNDGRGRFEDVTEQLAPELRRIGMVTDALWEDVDADGRLDLVVVGEWMPITIFRNTGERLTKMEVPALARSHGWWNRIVAHDVNGDGRVDFVAGNFGLNSRIRVSESEPAQMYVKDFDRNGFAEQILTTYSGGRAYPFPLRDDLVKALPFLKTRFLNYKDYASKSIADVFTPAELQDALVRSAHTFTSAVVRNDGNGAFTLVALPPQAQVAPVHAIHAADLDGDGRSDLLLAGNFDGFRPDIGRMAAGFGTFLRGSAAGSFEAVGPLQSGFSVPGQARDIQPLRTRSGTLYIVVRNDDVPLFFRRQATSAIASAVGGKS